MSSFIEFVFACELKQDIPEQVIDVLHYMTGQDYSKLDKHPNHPLFQVVLGFEVLRGDSVAYFAGDANISFRYDTISKTYKLTVRNYFKAMGSQGELQKFLDWIAPYSQTGSAYDDEYSQSPAELTFVGYMRHEESLHPILIYFEDGRVFLSRNLSPRLERLEITRWFDYI
jgi:hypothetical protein